VNGVCFERARSIEEPARAEALVCVRKWPSVRADHPTRGAELRSCGARIFRRFCPRFGVHTPERGVMLWFPTPA
jgi:hypothetical protein